MSYIQVLFAALLAFASAKPKPLVLEYPVAAAYTAPVAAAYTAPVAYSAYSAYDYTLPYSAYSYAAPYTYYVRWKSKTTDSMKTDYCANI